MEWLYCFLKDNLKTTNQAAPSGCLLVSPSVLIHSVAGVSGRSPECVRDQLCSPKPKPLGLVPLPSSSCHNFCFPLQDLENSSRQQEELLREQAALKEEIREYLRRRKECQERHRRRENQLQQLQKKIEEKETELAQQEVVTSPLTCLTSS